MLPLTLKWSVLLSTLHPWGNPRGAVCVGPTKERGGLPPAESEVELVLETDDVGVGVAFFG